MVVGSGGTFNAGTALCYRISYVDTDGNETQASQEQAIQFEELSRDQLCENLLVAGSRRLPISQSQYFHIFDNASYVFDRVFSQIISGGANGTDKMVERWAKAKGYRFREYPADWKKYGNRAGYLRNTQMADACSAAILVWDGTSKGTKMMYDLLLMKDRPFVLVRVNRVDDGY